MDWPQDSIPKVGRALRTDERLSMPEAIAGYTTNGAYLTCKEDTKGTLEPGKLADIVVLSEDLLTIDPERLLDVKVNMTIVDGKILYERLQEGVARLAYQTVPENDATLPKAIRFALPKEPEPAFNGHTRLGRGPRLFSMWSFVGDCKR